MRKIEAAPPRGELIDLGVVAAAAAAACAVVVLTHGAASPFWPLLCLPLLFAVVRCSLPVVLLTGAFMAASHLLIYSSFTPLALRGADGQEGLRALMIFGMALAGGLYSRFVRTQKDPHAITPAEREGLLGMAYTDPMTGLYNFRKFRSHLDEEVKRAARYGHSLSLILIDLDGFKDVNDTYGHPAGDRVLAAIATVIRATVRETDLPARYGGEEFVVVCPETDAEEAVLVAERIRAGIEAARYESSPGHASAITCSAGVATFPDHAHDEIGLIEAADGALYHAKEHGKNRVDSPVSIRPR